MKKVAMKAVVATALMALVSAPAVRAAEATVGVDVSSAYVWRGITLNDGFVAQPYLEVSGLPIDIGVWGNLDIEDYDGALKEGEFSEVNFYLSYALPIEGVDVAIGYTEYVYPNAEAEADREVNLTLGLDLPLAPTLGLYYGVDGAAKENFYAEFGIGHDLEIDENLTLSLGALIGYLYPDEGEDGFHQYELSASLTYDFVTLGVKYIGQADDKVLTDDLYDVEVVGTLSLSYTF
ncbi:MAG TPA: MltA-interacting MipA family protein [Kiritimatiellia bacterium]|nr:MltA-interacting MipA family protein [Kiritimatiellia bacterium]HMO98100.1 MltA-interacting MipA family protein [Kiritimatiellia bacterium]HMP96320.1 MltA-interacting MipA family protein [Kiritimatiellia bacterium]